MWACLLETLSGSPTGFYLFVTISFVGAVNNPTDAGVHIYMFIFNYILYQETELIIKKQRTVLNEDNRIFPAL